MRIQKYLSEQGILSRREAENLIRDKKILINGKVANLGEKLDPLLDKIKIIGLKENKAKKETVIINKPRGIVSSRVKNEGKTIYEMFSQYEHLHITGRLDKESQGLILLTNDGTLVKKITGDKHEVEKEYQVTVRENILESQLEAMAKGVKLEDGLTLPAKTKRIGKNTFSITLKEGRNHQIRRMADKVHLTITKLTRIRIGNISLGDLKEGKVRRLTEEQVLGLKTKMK